MTRLIVGLGNVGKRYAHTRHNAGWDAIEAFAHTLDTMTFTKNTTFHAEIIETHLDGQKLLIARPLTYMNQSGEAVQALMQYFHVNLPDILVVHDEMDLPIGKISFLKQGGTAGHRGIASIQEQVKTDAFARLRIGIGRPSDLIKKEDYVLERVNENEQQSWKDAIKQSTQAIHTWLDHGIDRAMNKWNGQ